MVKLPTSWGTNSLSSIRKRRASLGMETFLHRNSLTKITFIGEYRNSLNKKKSTQTALGITLLGAKRSSLGEETTSRDRNSTRDISTTSSTSGNERVMTGILRVHLTWEIWHLLHYGKKNSSTGEIGFRYTKNPHATLLDSSVGMHLVIKDQQFLQNRNWGDMPLFGMENLTEEYTIWTINHWVKNRDARLLLQHVDSEEECH